MEREVFLHVPDVKCFFEENPGAKKPVIKTGTEILFKRCFYKYQQLKPSKELENQFLELENVGIDRIIKLFG